jgi:hypothetical protein
MTILSKVIDGITYSVDSTTLPPAGTAYLLAYGFSQALGDTQAMGKEDRAKAYAKALKDGTTNGQDEATWIAAFLAAKAQARLDAIVAGDMVFGSMERLTPEEKDRRTVIDEKIAAWAKAKGVKVPKDAEKINVLRDKLYATHGAAIDAEVARMAKERANRLKNTASLDDAFADVRF